MSSYRTQYNCGEVCGGDGTGRMQDTRPHNLDSGRRDKETPPPERPGVARAAFGAKAPFKTNRRMLGGIQQVPHVFPPMRISTEGIPRQICWYLQAPSGKPETEIEHWSGEPTRHLKRREQFVKSFCAVNDIHEAQENFLATFFRVHSD